MNANAPETQLLDCVSNALALRCRQAAERLGFSEETWSRASWAVGQNLGLWRHGSPMAGRSSKVLGQLCGALTNSEQGQHLAMPLRLCGIV